MTTETLEQDVADATEIPSEDDGNQQEVTQLRRKASHLLDVEVMNQELREKFSVWQTKKNEAALAKKDYECHVEELSDLIASGPDAQQKLFDKNDEPEVWREVALESLGISEKLLEKLAENGRPIKTLGDIADWTKEFELTDIDGIGPAKAEDIQAACDKYWAEHPVDDEPDDEPSTIGVGQATQADEESQDEA